MDNFWIFQLVFDVVVVGWGGFYVLYGRKKALFALENQATAILNVLDRRVERFEQEARLYGERLNEMMKKIIRISDDANKILEKSRWQWDHVSVTLEERELRGQSDPEKETSHPSRPSLSSRPEIPTVQILETAKLELSNQVRIPLKDLLRDQLA